MILDIWRFYERMLFIVSYTYTCMCNMHKLKRVKMNPSLIIPSLFFASFQWLEVVCRGSETQLQVT